MNRAIYGIHDIEGAHILNGKGYVIAIEAIGDDPSNQSGVDYTTLSKGATVISRINKDYGATIPTPDKYYDYAQRCASFVKNSQGCNWFILSNETNLSIEWPSDDIITPQDYARCYNLCYWKIKEVCPDCNIIPAAIGPWNIESGYWIDYFKQVLSLIDDCQGIALHVYTHGPNPDLIFSEEKMEPPYENEHYHFRVYRDFMNAIPLNLRHLPVYITETNQNGAWADVNSGWVKNAYSEINEWNQGGNQQIRCLCLYRWPHYDQYYIEGKQGVIQDLQDAQQKSYTWSNDMAEKFIDSFENGRYQYEGIPELDCPTDWIPVWIQGTEPGVNHRIEVKPKERQFQPEVYHGDWATSIHTRNATHTGALTRQFDASPGQKFSVSVMGMIKGVDNGHGVTIGIDPTGGTAIESESIVWGDWWSQYMSEFVEGAWRKVECTAQAQGNKITVFLKSQADFAGDGMHAHFDLFEMETEEGIPPIPPGDNILDDMLLTIDAMQAQLDNLRGMVEYLQANTIQCIPVEVV